MPPSTSWTSTTGCEATTGLSSLKTYLKAWNAKIIPIFLTIISTILGFTPFLVGTQKEGFWFPLAAGTIGGLIMSFMDLYLPASADGEERTKQN